MKEDDKLKALRKKAAKIPNAIEHSGTDVEKFMRLFFAKHEKFLHAVENAKSKWLHSRLDSLFPNETAGGKLAALEELVTRHCKITPSDFQKMTPEAKFPYAKRALSMETETLGLQTSHDASSTQELPARNKTATALGLLAAHPEWPVKRIAKEARVTANHLYKHPIFKKAREAQRASRKTHKSARNPRTGENEVYSNDE